MKIGIDSFQATAKIWKEKFFDILEMVKRTVRAERAEYSPRIVETLSRFRKENFLKEIFAKAVTQAKNMGEDLLFWLRENAFLKDGRISFKDTYARVVVRREYAKHDLIALFIIAVILGAGLKSIATGTVTIGFEDYTLAPEETLYDLNALQKKLIDEGGRIDGSTVAEGEACSE